MGTLYLYFSGTGNTKLIIETFAHELEDNPIIYSIEHDNIDYATLIQQHQHITFGYPIYESMLPHIMNDFISNHLALLTHKTIQIIVTQMLFSGDGAGLLARRLQKRHNLISNTIHINMPNNLTDVHLFRPKHVKDRTEMVDQSLSKLRHITEQIKLHHTFKMGRKWYSRLLGLFVQRLYAKPFYNNMKSKLKVQDDLCISCNKCVPLCPTNNLKLVDNKIQTNNQCTLCYRCINLCPTKALSLFMKHGPKTQYIRDSFH